MNIDSLLEFCRRDLNHDIILRKLNDLIVGLMCILMQIDRLKHPLHICRLFYL